MIALEEKILRDGTVFPGDILKVDCFLNHQVDVKFHMEMGKEIARLYENTGVNKILTIETSGIPIAFAAAQFMNVPVVFAKKNKSGNISDNFYSSRVESFTKKNVFDAIVSKEYLSSDTLLAKRALAAYMQACGEREKALLLLAQAEELLQKEWIRGVADFEKILLSRLSSV